MKHRIAVAAVLALGAAPLYAQTTSVQLSGQIGAGISSKNHQSASDGRLVEVNDNLLNTSYLRFSGTENLGGGLSTVFSLESGLAIDTGGGGAGTVASPGAFWNRQSWVGLDLGGGGRITLGRQFHASTDRVIRSLDVYNVAAPTLHTVPLGLFGVNRFSANDTRVSNSVKYRVAVPEVIDAGLSVGLGEGSGGRSYAADLAHVTKKYTVGGFYVSYDAPPTARLANGTLPRYTTSGVGGNAAFGPAKIYALWLVSSLDATALGRPAQGNKVLDLGLMWSLNPATYLKFAYYDDKGTNMNNVLGRNGKKNTYIGSIQYLVSKRTELYAAAFENRFSGGYQLDPVNIAALNRNAKESSVLGFGTGIRHLF